MRPIRDEHSSDRMEGEGEEGEGEEGGEVEEVRYSSTIGITSSDGLQQRRVQ